MKTNTILSIALVFAAFLLFTLPVVNAESNLKVSKANLMFTKNTFSSKILDYKVSDKISNYKAIKDIFSKTSKNITRAAATKTPFGYNTRINVVVKDDLGNPIPNAIVTVTAKACHVENTSICLSNTNYLRGYGVLANAQGIATFDFDFISNYPGVVGSNNVQYEIKVPRVVFLDGKFARDEYGYVGPYNPDEQRTNIYQTFGPEKSAYFNESDLLGNEVTVNFKVLTGSANFSAVTKDSLGNTLRASYLPELQAYTAITSNNSAMILNSSEKAYAGCVETQKFNIAEPFDFGEAYAGWNCTFAVSETNPVTYVLDFTDSEGRTGLYNAIMNDNQTYKPTVVLE